MSLTSDTAGCKNIQGLSNTVHVGLINLTLEMTKKKKNDKDKKKENG